MRGIKYNNICAGHDKRIFSKVNKSAGYFIGGIFSCGLFIT